MAIIGVFSAVALGAVLLVGIFSYLLVRYYNDPRDGSKLNTCVSTLAIAIGLFAICLIPIDIYIVSSSLDEMGFPTDPDAVASAADGIKFLYYGMYGLMIAFAFLVMPFAYFFFEEDAEDITTGKRALGALKYTMGFVIIFGALLAIGLILKNPKPDNLEDWQDQLANNFGAGEAVMMFTIGCLSIFGLAGWVFYAGYGLAALPISLMRKAQPVATLNVSPTELNRNPQDIVMELRKTQEMMKYLSSRYEDSGRAWTTSDKKRFNELKADEKRLLAQKSRMEGGGGASGDALGRLTAATSCCGKIWNAFAPIRIIVGVSLLLISWLIVISMILSSVDRIANSTCGYSCGFALDEPNITNPIDELLKALSFAFPIDFIAFALFTVYFFFAIMHGLVQLGVRILIFKLYEVKKRATMPHAMLMGTWLVMFTVLVLNMQILTLSPTYASFGNQFYITAGNSTGNGTDIGGVKMPCDLQNLGEDRCIITQVGEFINTANLQLPFFSIVLFFANLGFLLMFILSHLWVLCRKPKDTSADDYKRLQEASIWDD